MSGGRTGLEALLPGGRGVWVPIDHGASDWPVPGLHDIDGLVAALSEGGADAVVAQKGLISHLLRTGEAPAIGLVINGQKFELDIEAPVSAHSCVLSRAPFRG